MDIFVKIIFCSSVSFIVYTYLLYPLILKFWSDLKRGESKSASSDDDVPSVTMVVAAYNEEKVIEAKLRNIMDLDYPKNKFKAIIASDGSNDRTNEIVKKYISKGIELIEFPRIGKVNVLNKAVLIASGEIIVFSDANTMYNSQALKKLINRFRDPDVGCVSGQLKLINPKNIQSGEGEGLYWRYETWIKRNESRLGRVAGANGAIYAIRKALFIKMPPNVINDDFHISMKLFEKGYKIVYESEAIGTEEVAPDFRSEFSRHVRDGAGHYREIAHFSRLLNPFMGARFFVFISHRLIRWMVPFFLILTFISNLALLRYPDYIVIFMLQLCLYITAGAAFILQKYHLKTGPLNVPLYFLALNLALLIGFWRNAMGKQSVTWNRTER